VAGWNVDALHDGHTLLHIAVGLNHLHIIQYLLKAGADTMRNGTTGSSPLAWACGKYADFEVFCALLHVAGAGSLVIPDACGMCALQWLELDRQVQKMQYAFSCPTAHVLFSTRRGVQAVQDVADVAQKQHKYYTKEFLDQAGMRLGIRWQWIRGCLTTTRGNDVDAQGTVARIRRRSYAKRARL
jgi:hypothetical protein